MISLNVPNAITIAAIAILAFAAVKAAGTALGFSTSWL